MTVIDIRPDRFLRELRDCGEVIPSMEKAGFTQAELDELLDTNEPFRITVRECLMEYHEDKLVQQFVAARDLMLQKHRAELKELDVITAKAIQEMRNGFGS